MKILYASSRIAKLRHEVITNNKAIPKKMIISILIGSVLGNLFSYQNNVIFSSLTFGIIIYSIISIFTYCFIFLNNKIVAFITALAIVIGIYYTEKVSIMPLVFFIDIILLTITPILTKLNKNIWKKREKPKKQRFEKKKETSTQQLDPEENKYKYFRNCNTREQIKKTYHELIKIYHPDAKTGETKTFNEIQSEYMQIMKELTNEK